jgi:protein tyrosine/serine phosphatase
MKYLTRSFHKAFGFLAVAFGTLLLPSCAEEFLSDDQVDDGIEMVINVGTDTRTTNEGDHTLWADDDSLTVIHAPEDGNEFLASPFNKSGDNAFTGKVKRLSSSNDWYVVYPYKEENLAADQISLTFPASQTQTGNENKLHLAGEQFPLWGKVKGLPRGQTLNVQMQNLLAVAGFKVTNTTDGPVTVKQVQFTAPTSVSGTFTVDLTGDAPVLTAGTGATKVVTLNVESGEELAAEATSWFYMAVTPFEAPAGSKLKIKVIATDSEDKDVVFYQTKTLVDATSFKSGSIKTVNIAYDTAHTTDPDAGSAGEVPLEPGDQPADGDYLLVYEDGENSYAFAAFADKETDNYAIPVTVVDGVVLPSETEDLARYAMTIENAGFTHPNDPGHDAYNVKNSEGKFIFYASGGGNTKILRIQDTNELYNTSSQQTVAYYHTFIQEEDGVQILSSGAVNGYNQYLLTYSDAKGFHYSNEEADQGKKLHLYFIGGSAKERQTPYFSQERVEYDFDASGPGVLANAPTLNGAMTSVTYSSSDESVASVDAEGNVTIHKAGTATITATAAADDVYYSASAQYLIVSTTSAGTTFYRVTELNAGEQYLIVSAGKALANNNGTIGATDVSASGDEVIVSDAALMMWTATASENGFTLSNNGQYIQRASSSGKPSVGNAPSTSRYYIWTYSDGKMYTVSGTAYYLYYSNGWAQTSTASNAGTVTIYSSTRPLASQSLSFANSTVNKILGENCQIGDTFNVQEVEGAMTEVTYTSSKPRVATINGKVITVVGKGSTTITATAAEENGYKSATATYTLRITEPATGDFVNLNELYNDGLPFNLENNSVRDFLNAAESQYTDTNYKGTNKITIVSNYTSGSERKDIPKPVPIQWETASTGTATITIFTDEEMMTPVWVQTTTSGKRSADVYNLIPDQTYYCTVEDDSGELLKGVFETTGRRRMIKVCEEKDQDHGSNCRDLGGLKTTDGRRIKYGMIFRGTNLDGTKDKNNNEVFISNYVEPNNTEQGLLANYLNIGYDIDLRGGGTEAFLNKYHVTYVYGNMQPYLSDVTNASKARTTLQGFFDAAAAGKASYFHCAIGSDRTGFWGLLIEGLLGVSVRDCSIDFELTSFFNIRERTNTNYLFYQGMENTSGSFKGLANYDGATFQEKCANYVKSLATTQYPFTDQWIETFRNNILEYDPDL